MMSNSVVVWVSCLVSAIGTSLWQVLLPQELKHLAVFRQASSSCLYGCSEQLVLPFSISSETAIELLAS